MCVLINTLLILFIITPRNKSYKFIPWCFILTCIIVNSNIIVIYENIIYIVIYYSNKSIF